jgi:hypothetical protein
MFCRHLEYITDIWYILWSFGIFYGHLVNLVLVFLLPFWYFVSRKKSGNTVDDARYGTYLCTNLASRFFCCVGCFGLHRDKLAHYLISQWQTGSTQVIGARVFTRKQRFKKIREPGTDVMIFKYFCRKIWRKKMAGLTQNKAKLSKILIITLVFEKNAIFSQKINKNRRKLWS